MAAFYNAHMRLPWLVCALSTVLVTSIAAQTPQPFPRGSQQPPPAVRVPPRPVQAPAPAPAPATPPPAVAAPTAPADPATPTEATLGFPIYAGAQFLASYDAGRGQRY